MKNGEYEFAIAPDDYPGMKYRGRYCYEHQLVWWMNTGEVPNEDELIHHKNGKKRDNRFENLEKQTRREHTSHHAGGRTMTRIRCPFCGIIFVKERRLTHLIISSKTATFCSRRCNGKFFVKGQQLSNDKKRRIETSVIDVFKLHIDGTEEIIPQ